MIIINRNGFRRAFWRVVNPDVEIRYTLVVIWLIIIAFVISGLITYLAIWNSLLTLPQLTQPDNLLVLQRKALKILGFEFLLGGLLAVLLAAVLSFRILHRIAGPLHRLEKMVQEAASGKLPETPIVFRRKDLYGELAESFNKLVAAIRSGSRFD